MSDQKPEAPASLNHIRVLHLDDYVSPTATENKDKGWVEYGDANDFFDYLVELYNNSPTNSACIRGTSNLIYGQGLEAVGADKKVEGYVNLRSVFKATDVRNVCNDFKAFGLAAFELISNQARNKVASAVHIPMNYLRSGLANSDGRVDTWWYSTNWKNVEDGDDESRKPTPIPVFNPGEDNTIPTRSLLIIQPYTFGSFYYSTPDYIGALNWADVESEISNYHLSNLQNGMWPGMLINFNNGVPDEDQQVLIEKDVKKKFARGSKAGRMILAFNRDKESAATIEPVQLSDAAEQFIAIASEATEKILLGHRITSPMLLGIKNNSGLGNNADELKSAHALFVNTVVKPMQDPILEAIGEVLVFNGYNLQLYFKPLTPLEFKSYEIPMDKDTQEKETGMELSAISDDAADFLISAGEEEDLENYEEVDARKVNYDTDDQVNAYLRGFSLGLEPPASSGLNLATVPKGRYTSKSEQDSPLFKVRYRYRPLAVNTTGNHSREFCKKMVKANRVYRKEDIQAAGTQQVNPGWGPHGANDYSIWLYKGGGDCHHFWERAIYLRKNNKTISVNEARRRLMEIDPALRDELRVPTNEKKVAQRPTDMEYRGFLPDNPRIKNAES